MKKHITKQKTSVSWTADKNINEKRWYIKGKTEIPIKNNMHTTIGIPTSILCFELISSSIIKKLINLRWLIKKIIYSRYFKNLIIVN